MPTAFQLAFAFTMESEGGLADDPNDPGGVTFFGVSSRAFPPDRLFGIVGKRDVSALTRSDVEAIYAQCYYRAVRAESFPWPVPLILADCAFHAGVGTSGLLLQREAWLPADQCDSRVGPVTIAAARRRIDRIGALEFARALATARRRFNALAIKRNPRLSVFREGWSQRLMDLGFYVARHPACSD